MVSNSRSRAVVALSRLSRLVTGRAAGTASSHALQLLQGRAAAVEQCHAAGFRSLGLAGSASVSASARMGFGVATLRQFAASADQAAGAAALAKARRMSLWVGGGAGVLGSMVGVGGGVLISPIIANACKALPQRVIAGSSLAAVLATGLASGAVFYNSGSADLTSALLLGIPAVLLAPYGAKATHVFDSNKLRYAMGVWLYAAAPLVPLKALLLGGTAPPAATAAAAGNTAASAGSTAPAGAMVGGAAGGNTGSTVAPGGSTCSTASALATPTISAGLKGHASTSGKEVAGASAVVAHGRSATVHAEPEQQASSIFQSQKAAADTSEGTEGTAVGPRGKETPRTPAGASTADSIRAKAVAVTGEAAGLAAGQVSSEDNAEDAAAAPVAPVVAAVAAAVSDKPVAAAATVAATAGALGIPVEPSTLDLVAAAKDGTLDKALDAATGATAHLDGMEGEAARAPDLRERVQGGEVTPAAAADRACDTSAGRSDGSCPAVTATAEVAAAADGVRKTVAGSAVEQQRSDDSHPAVTDSSTPQAAAAVADGMRSAAARSADEKPAVAPSAGPGAEARKLEAEAGPRSSAGTAARGVQSATRAMDGGGETPGMSTTVVVPSGSGARALAAAASAIGKPTTKPSASPQVPTQSSPNATTADSTGGTSTATPASTPVATVHAASPAPASPPTPDAPQPDSSVRTTPPPASWLQSLPLRPLVPGDALLLVTGAAAGFASGLLGIGGGSLVTPALALFTAMPQAQVVGTSLVAMVLPGASGLISHARLGNVDLRVALGLGVGTLGGALAGSSYALSAPPLVLESLFAVVMAVLGHRMLAGLRAAKAK